MRQPRTWRESEPMRQPRTWRESLQVSSASLAEPNGVRNSSWGPTRKQAAAGSSRKSPAKAEPPSKRIKRVVNPPWRHSEEAADWEEKQTMKMVRQPRGQPQGPKRAPAPEWACTHCTLLNPTKCKRCNACNKARPEGRPASLGSREGAASKAAVRSTYIRSTYLSSTGSSSAASRAFDDELQYGSDAGAEWEALPLLRADRSSTPPLVLEAVDPDEFGEEAEEADEAIYQHIEDLEQHIELQSAELDAQAAQIKAQAAQIAEMQVRAALQIPYRPPLRPALMLADTTRSQPDSVLELRIPHPLARWQAHLQIQCKAWRAASEWRATCVCRAACPPPVFIAGAGPGGAGAGEPEPGPEKQPPRNVMPASRRAAND